MSESHSFSETGNVGVDNNEGGSEAAAMETNDFIPQEIPFLVTHWLANYDNQ